MKALMKGMRNCLYSPIKAPKPEPFRSKQALGLAPESDNDLDPKPCLWRPCTTWPKTFYASLILFKKLPQRVQWQRENNGVGAFTRNLRQRLEVGKLHRSGRLSEHLCGLFEFF